MVAAICATASAQSATVIDTLKGPDGAAFEGAFVQAQNTKNCIAANVLTGIAGGYGLDRLPAGEYNLRIPRC
jgi:hypothetical protein